MAAAMVGGAFLSAFLQVLFDRIASREVVDYLQGKKFNHRLLLKLKIVLLSVNRLLDDAEEKQIRNLTVKEWLDELESAAYDTDDLLDEIATEALKAGSRTSSEVSTFNPTHLNFHDLDIEAKMEENLERLEFLVKQKDVLGLKEFVGEKSSVRIPTTSLVDETDVYGRDDDKEAIIKLLLRDDDDDDVGNNQVNVIPIVGMAGIGKTALAQLVYNDDKVKEHFDFRVWVCISEEFDIFKATKTVLSAITSHCCDNMDLDLLQVRLKEVLVGNKFLIVLDDVWNENYVSWDVMSKPFKHGAQGSKIIVTARCEKVASIMRTGQNYYLKFLLNEDCQQLFAKHVFGHGESSAHPVLETIGREIVKKCKGLPLAVKTLGGLLRFKLDVGEWERILNSDIWDLSANESDILPALWLSYHHPPSHLKRCFAFCSIFPKGYEFEKRELVLLWMAENLLWQTKSNKRMEEVGDEYFNDLVSRSFFVQSGADISRFIMHDLMADLAKFVSKEYCFTLEEGSSKGIVMKVRHLAFVTEYVKRDLKRLDSVFEAIRLCTLLPLEMNIFTSTYLSNEVVNEVLSKLKCLRTLSLSKIQGFNHLPESIGELRHLRYLDLSETMIDRLPESVSTLYNLQTLNLSECYYLTELPKDMHQLINLRYLDISYCYKLVEMPRQVSKLKNLQTLSAFFVGKENGTKIEELRELSNLHKKLSIENLQNVVNAKDALEAKLKNKKYLEELQFSWKGEPDDSKHDMNVLDKLLPHTNLAKLYIKGYGGTRFPNWLGNRSFCNIVFIELSGCKYCNCLPPLGQLPSLKTLNMYDLCGVVTVGAEFYGDSSSAIKAFPSLEALHIRQMPNWEEWFPMQGEFAGAFMNLQELEIGYCDRLITIGLPYCLPSLVKQIIDGCQALTSSLPRTPAIRQFELGNCEKLELKELPPTVESIRIGGRKGVESLVGTLRNSQISFLQCLHIHDCPSSITFPAECLSRFLTELSIHNREKLDFPMHHSLKMSLQKVHISNSCGSLEFFNLDFFSNLKNLDIIRCKNLESLVLSDPSQDLTNLSSLTISGCPNFMSFPKGGLPTPNLIYFSLTDCEKLKSMPEQMHNLLLSLQWLHISDCPQLESFPETGLPSNLSTLKVKNCSKLVARRMNWNLKTLQALAHFTIGDKSETVELFPDEGLLLPTTITTLKIDGLSFLKTLDIERLQQLDSLKELYIISCPLLQKFPDERMPTSLMYLEIYDCPILEERCQKDKGEDWNKISHIPQIETMKSSSLDELYMKTFKEEESFTRLKPLGDSETGDFQWPSMRRRRGRYGNVQNLMGRPQVEKEN